MYKYVVFKSGFTQPKTEALGTHFIAQRIYTKARVGGKKLPRPTGK